MKITDPTKGIIEFIPRNYQTQLFKKLDECHPINLVSSRQMGATTTMLAYIVNDLIKSPKTVFYFTDKNVACRHLMSKFILLLDELLYIKRNNEIILPNGSCIKFISYKFRNTNIIFNGDIYVDNSKYMSNYNINQLQICIHPNSNIKYFAGSNIEKFTNNYETVNWSTNLINNI